MPIETKTFAKEHDQNTLIQNKHLQKSIMKIT
jgi:hypothetical protein